MKSGTGEGGQPGDAGKILCGMQSRAGFIDHTPMIQRASQLLGDLTGRYQPCGVRETMLQKRRFALERIVVLRFEGGGKVADTAVLAIQTFARYQFLNVSIGVNRNLEHSPSPFLAILFN